MQTAVTEILAKRRDRAIAIILGLKEREVDQYLPAEARTKLRKVILDQLNDVTDLAADLLSSYDTGDTLLNERYLQKLDEIHAAVVE